LKSHVRDRELRILISAGPTLRKFSEDPASREQLLALKDDNRRRWPLDGFHIAQVVERGLPLELITEATRHGMSPAEIDPLVTGFLLAARKFALFVQKDSDSSLVAQDVTIGLAAESDAVVVMCSMGRDAGAKLRRVLAELRKTEHYAIALSGESPTLRAIVTRKDSAALEPSA
jgi:hypothetical protein